MKKTAELLPFDKHKQSGNHIMDVQEFKATQTKEIDLQRECEQYLDILRLKYIRIPDAVYRAVFGKHQVSPGVKKLISSFIKGLPDLIVLVPGLVYNHALCIELKTKDGKLSQGQKNFAKYVNLIVCRSFDDFKCEVERFLKYIDG